jgi:hypothetical protein
MFFVCAADNEAVALHAPRLYSSWQSAGKVFRFICIQKDFIKII